MMRRIIFLVVTSLLALTIYLFFQRMNNEATKETNDVLFQAIPTDAVLVLNSANFLGFNAELQNQNLVWKNLVRSQIFGDISMKLNKIDSLLQNNPKFRAQLSLCQAAISYHLLGKDEFVPLISMDLSDILPENTINSFIASHYKSTLNSRKYDNINLFYVNDSLNSFSYYFYNNCFVYSPSELLLEHSARVFSRNKGISSEPNFKTVLSTKGDNASATLFINIDKCEPILESITTQAYAQKLFPLVGQNSWFGLDVSLQSNLLSFIGFYNSNSNSYLETITTQSPKKMGALEILPVGAQQFFSINIGDISFFRPKYEDYLQSNNTYEDYSILNQKLTNIFGKDPISTADNLFNGEFIKVNFGGIANGETVEYLLAGVKGRSLAENTITELITYYCKTKNEGLKNYISELKIDDDLSIKTYKFPHPELLESFYGELLNTSKLNYLGFVDNYLILAPNKEVLKQIIYANILGKTLTHQSYYQDFFENFTNEFNVLWYQDCRSIPQTSKSIFSKEINSKLLGNNRVFDNLNGIGFQLIETKNNMVYTNISIDYSGEQKSDAETIWQSLLDTSIAIKPALVENHYTKEKEIFVQDNFNTIYLVSPSGRILWKKPIDGKIISAVTQVDRYKNSKLQLLFNTASKMYLIDRNGNHVERFPITFPSKSTAGIALVDYDKTKDYRIFVPLADKRVLLYGIDGNTIKGWNFGKTDHLVERPVQHFRINSKDYILFADKNRVYIQNRQGRTRIKLSETLLKNSNADFFLELAGPGGAPAILTGDTQGNLITIMQSGTILKRKLPVNTTDYYLSVENLDGLGSKEVVVLEDNVLRAFDQRGNLKFKTTFENTITDAPHLYKFAARDFKIGILNREESKIYLVNNDGTFRDEFPILGTTPFSIGFLKANAGGFNLVVGGKDNFLYNYIID